MSILKKEIKIYIKENEKNFLIDIFDLNKITQLVYGVSIDLVSVEKNTFIEMVVSNQLSFEDLELINDAIINEIAEKEVYNLIFNDICSKKHIDPGKYTISAFWD